MTLEELRIQFERNTKIIGINQEQLIELLSKYEQTYDLNATEIKYITKNVFMQESFSNVATMISAQQAQKILVKLKAQSKGVK